jgi:hypothetical protein
MGKMMNTDTYLLLDASSMEDHAIFGMALQEAVSLTKLSEKDLVPAVLRRCINYLDEYGKDLLADRPVPVMIYSLYCLKVSMK